MIMYQLKVEKGTRVPPSWPYNYILNDFRNRHECIGGISDDTECCWSDGSTDLVNIADSKDKNNWKMGLNSKYNTFQYIFTWFSN